MGENIHTRTRNEMRKVSKHRLFGDPPGSKSMAHTDEIRKIVKNTSKSKKYVKTQSKPLKKLKILQNHDDGTTWSPWPYRSPETHNRMRRVPRGAPPTLVHCAFVRHLRC